jgi:hypothetical protein
MPVPEHPAAPPEPFLVRPYHLDKFLEHFYLMNFGNPESRDALAQQFRFEVQDWALATTLPESEKQQMSRQDRQYLKHAADIFGSTPEAAERHATAVIAIYNDFMTLPDETPVRIAPDKDRLCLETCAVGALCAAASSHEEKRKMADFVKMAGRAGIVLGITSGAVDTTLGAIRSTFVHDIGKPGMGSVHYIQGPTG